MAIGLNLRSEEEERLDYMNYYELMAEYRDLKSNTRVDGEQLAVLKAKILEKKEDESFSILRKNDEFED